MNKLLITNIFGELLTLSICLLFGLSNSNHLDVFIFSNLTWFVGSILTKNYYINRLPGAIINLINLTKWFVLFYLLFFLYIKLFHEFNNSNFELIKLFIIIYFALITWRLLVFYALKISLKNSRNKINIIIAGVSVSSIHLKKFLDKRPQYNLNVLGFFSNNEHLNLDESIHILGNYDDIKPYCLSNKVSEIICSVEKLEKKLLNSLIDFSENNLISIKLLPETNDVYERNFATTFLEYIPLLILRKNAFDEISNKFIKRLFDIVFSVFIIVFVLSWLFPIISLIILLDSRGPVFFVQERTGLLKKSFYCLKFRTMKITNDNKQATRNDWRVTRVGKFLRKTSLDELPQFLNVLAGNMSLVGPRPHMVKHTEEYSQLVDKYMLRHLVKPGITGLSQIMGYRGETQHDLHLMKMRVRMDRFYIENWSFYLDIKIVYATVLMLFKNNEQAY
ncbi:MAG: exopolysaccharide biosynthesis polyprenyl glycosylphosphotransferase [Bacteroidota bacterium]